MTCQPMPQAPSVGDFPIVLLEPDVVLAQVNPKGFQAIEVELLHVVRRRLQDDLELRVLEKPVRIFAIASVGRTARRLHVGHAVARGQARAGTSRGASCRRRLRRRSGCCSAHPRAQNSCSFRMSSWKVSGLGWGSGMSLFVDYQFLVSGFSVLS